MDVFFPPGPQKSLLFGNAPELQRDPLNFMHDSARKYGEIVHFRFGPSHAYLVTSPAYAHYVLVERADRFSETQRLMRTINSAFGHDLRPPKDTIKKQLRPQTLFRESWLDDHIQSMATLADAMVAGWDVHQPREMVGEFRRLTLKLMAHALLDTTTTDVAARMSEALVASRQLADRGFQSPLALPQWLPLPGPKKSSLSARDLDTMIHELIAERRAEGANKNANYGGLLAKLIEAADARGNSPATEAQARDEAVALFLAGHETTAHTLAWAFYLLAQNPDAEAMLHAELDAALGGRVPTAADLEPLAFTHRVVRETLRLYPPAWLISRQATIEIQLGNYYLPSGSTVFVSPYIMQRRSRYFADPEAFIPERFMDGYERRIPRYAYMPFGGGTRAGLESGIAVTETAVLLATIAQRVRLSIQPGTVAEPEPGLTLRPKDGLMMKVSSRQSSVVIFQ